MDPIPEQMAAAKAVGADRVELYTEPFAANWGKVDQEQQLQTYAKAAQAALDASDTDGYYKVYKALKKADFTFVGPTICYAYMQAAGMVMDHTTDCDRYPLLVNPR